MAEPRDESESHVERRVVYETVSASSTRSSAITIAIILVIAIALIAWIGMQVF
jgi:hypothetical protein